MKNYGRRVQAEGCIIRGIDLKSDNRTIVRRNLIRDILEGPNRNCEYVAKSEGLNQDFKIVGNVIFG